MMPRNYIAVAVAACLLSISACADREGDAKRLGFDSAKEMDDIRAAGYSTKQKYLEMGGLAEARRGQPILATSPAPSNVEAAPTAAPKGDVPNPSLKSPSEQPVGPSTNAATGSTSAPQPATPQGTAAAIDLDECVDVGSCVNIMLRAARADSFTGAIDVATKIDGFVKPARGDRKRARQLNQQGLDALRRREVPEAIMLLTKARNADLSDEEVIGNLIFAYVEDNNYTKATILALDGFALNPRSANLWLSFGVAQQKQGKSKDALAAIWLAWQFSKDREKMLNWLNSKIADEKDEAMASFYVKGKAWVTENKSPP